MAACRARDSTSDCHVKAAEMTFFSAIVTFLTFLAYRLEFHDKRKSTLAAFGFVACAISFALTMLLTGDYYWEYGLIGSLFMASIGITPSENLYSSVDEPKGITSFF
jgi:hypothetical protein